MVVSGVFFAAGVITGCLACWWFWQAEREAYEKRLRAYERKNLELQDMRSRKGAKR